MSSYLARLKSEKRLLDVLPKPPKAPFDSKDSTEGRHFRENDTPATPEELHLLLGKALALIDLGGRPWSGWRRSLSEEQRQQLRRVEEKIDMAVLSIDRPGLLEALDEYRRLTLKEKKTHI